MPQRQVPSHGAAEMLTRMLLKGIHKGQQVAVLQSCSSGISK